MENEAFQDLIIDPEFSSLIAPLSESELHYLEESIRQEGCREPITVWGKIIVDGHNRFRICTRYGIHFRITYKEFADREDAISWICANQLGRRNISEETRKYLIGKRFDAEKHIRRRNNHSAGTFRLPAEQKDRIPEDLMKQREKQWKNPTAEQIAADYHLAHSTVEKYAIYSRALDTIGQKSPQMLPKILSGQYKISHENIVVLARMDAASVNRLESRLETQKHKSSSFVPFAVSREEIGDSVLEEKTPALHTEIKNMPAFDPDAEVNGLALTIPTWISFISRTREKVDLDVVSVTARRKLEEVLQDLMENIGAILQLIKE